MALHETSQVMSNLAGETRYGAVPKTTSNVFRIDWVGGVCIFNIKPTPICKNYTVKKERLLVKLDNLTFA